jgi:hypothetical protein
MICKSEEVIVSKAFRHTGMGCMHLNVEHVICSIAVRTHAYHCMTSMERCRVLFGLYALKAHIYANARPSQMNHAQPERRPWNRPTALMLIRIQEYYRGSSSGGEGSNNAC